MNAPLTTPLAGARIIEHGEIITEPGAFVMPAEWYHQACTDGPGISKSGLHTIASKSPAHFWLECPLNPDRVPRVETDAFRFGRAAHHLLLGEDGFADRYVVRPDEAPDGRAWNGNNNSCKAWLAEQAAAGMTVLKPDEIETIRGMAKSLAADPLVGAGVLNGSIETSLIWKDDETGIWLKARPDAIPADGNDVVDLKTANSVLPDDLAKAVDEGGYLLQGAVIRMGMRAVLGREMSSFSLVFVEKSAPYCVDTVTLKPEDLDIGEDLARAALRVFARCIRDNEWPGPKGRAADARFLEIPDWRRSRMRYRIETLKMEAA